VGGIETNRHSGSGNRAVPHKPTATHVTGFVRLVLLLIHSYLLKKTASATQESSQQHRRGSKQIVYNKWGEKAIKPMYI
jgi:hypothetical protein